MEPSDPATIFEVWAVMALVPAVYLAFLVAAVWGLVKAFRRIGRG